MASSNLTTTPLANGIPHPSKTNGFHVSMTNGHSKSNGHSLPYPQQNGFSNNHLSVPTTSGLATHPNLENGFAQPVQVKRPPFAFRILNQLNSLMGRKNENFDYTTTIDAAVVDPLRFQQSVTRNLAFPSTSSFASVKNEKNPKHLGEFYNNSTLTLIAKIFSIIVILVALGMMLRELFYGQGR